MTEFALKLTELIFMVASVIVATSPVDIKCSVENENEAPSSQSGYIAPDRQLRPRVPNWVSWTFSTFHRVHHFTDQHTDK